MSETTSAPAEGEQSTTEPDPSAQQGDPADKPLGPNGEKALKEERAARAAAEKTAAGYKAELDKIAEANLSEIEKAQKAAADAQAELAAISQQNLVNSRALAKGLPGELTAFITGADEAAVDAQIDTLLAKLNVTPTTPRPDLTQSSTRDTGKGGTPEADFAKFLKDQLG